MISDFVLAIIIAGVFTPIAIWSAGKEYDKTHDHWYDIPKSRKTNDIGTRSKFNRTPNRIIIRYCGIYQQYSLLVYAKLWDTWNMRDLNNSSYKDTSAKEKITKFIAVSVSIVFLFIVVRSLLTYYNR